MERKKFYNILVGILILIGWFIFMLRLIILPAFVWVLLALFSLLYIHFNFTPKEYDIKKGSTEEVIQDLEEYMERKADEKFGSDDEEETEDEYDFDEDIKIIKK